MSKKIMLVSNVRQYQEPKFILKPYFGYPEVSMAIDQFETIIASIDRSRGVLSDTPFLALTQVTERILGGNTAFSEKNV